MRQLTIHLMIEHDSMNGGEYVVNSETKPNIGHGSWRCCRNGHEAGV